MEKIAADNVSLKKFGVSLGIAISIISSIILYKGSTKAILTFIIALIFFSLSVFAPLLLRPIYIAWISLARLISWINTRIILIIMFYFIFTPMGLIAKLFRIDLIDRKIDKNKDSYWIAKDTKPFIPGSYERQF